MPETPGYRSPSHSRASRARRCRRSPARPAAARTGPTAAPSRTPATRPPPRSRRVKARRAHSRRAGRVRLPAATAGTGSAAAPSTRTAGSASRASATPVRKRSAGSVASGCPPRTCRTAVRNAKKSPRTSRGRRDAGAVPLPDPAPVYDYDEGCCFHAGWLLVAWLAWCDVGRYRTMVGGRYRPRQRPSAHAPTRTSARCCAGSAPRSRCRHSLRATARRPASRAAYR